MEYRFLADYPQAIPIIAQWYFDEWGYLKPGSTLGKTEDRIRDVYLNNDKVPLIIVAVEAEEAIAVCQLKIREMSIYPEKEHWLGGVYTSSKHRGGGVAKDMINHAVKIAYGLGVKTLYLQTENLAGGLYAKLRWEPIERVVNKGVDVLVMEKGVDVLVMERVMER
jgi:GNAT superfamily N-acetyltransferase